MNLSKFVLHERTRKVIRAIFGGIAGRLFGLIAPFIIMPAMLSYFGVRGFGIWATATSIASMAAFLDFGVGNALLTRLSRAFGQEDDAAVRALLAAGYVALGSVSLGVLCLGFAFWSFGAPVLAVFGIFPQPGEAAILAATLAGFILGLPASIIHRVFYARHQVWRSSLWQAAGAITSITACLLAMQLKLPAGWVALIYALSPVCIYLIATAFQFISTPRIRPGLADISWPEARNLLKTSMHFLALSVITSIVMNIDPILIGYKLGAEAVAHYIIPVRLGTLLMLAVTTLFLPLWAANGEAFARKDYAWVAQNTRKMSRYGAICVGILGLILTVLGDRIIMLWMKTSFPGQTEILAALALFSTIMALTSPYNMVLNALGDTRMQIAAWIGFGLSSVPLKYWLLEADKLWIVPLISAICYAVIITPVMVLGSAAIGKERQ